MDSRIGFMQGRLSNIVDNKIQAFPWESWAEEFRIASNNSIFLMEWTIDYQDLYKNPIMTSKGREKINKFCKEFKIEIPSLTGDCFMQKPFWKETNKSIIKNLFRDFIEICRAASLVGIKCIVVPLVDNGSIDNKIQEETLIAFLKENENIFIDLDISIIFESDKNPGDLLKFIEKLKPDLFGINYDIGNSASLGFDPELELNSYGNRVYNVHIKDRILKGTTVPLGEGNADFKKVFQNLIKINYDGNYILQTARAKDNDHIGLIKKYRKKVIDIFYELSF
tara:strand:- start:933 stop:1775 length:843 start_codon:yes stop_codon:yes gene_type:complete